MTDRPDVFTNVHKGIRFALFGACTALGRAAGDAQAEREAREQLDRALRFVAQHGDNEDFSFLPLLDERAPRLAERIRGEHERIEEELAALRLALGQAELHGLYLSATRFLAHYLEHMAGEELELEAQIRAVIRDDELREAGKAAVSRTDPSARTMMIELMLAALPPVEAEALRARLPKSA
jgi:hypothetical protein